MKKHIWIICVALMMSSSMQAQWAQLPAPTTQDLRDVAFVNADTGFVLSATAIYRTTDGGQSWVTSAVPPTGHFLYGLSVPKFGRKTTVYAVGGFMAIDFGRQTQDVQSVVMRTSNFGGSWETLVNASGIGQSRLEYAYFLNDSTGFVMGSWGPYIRANAFPLKTVNYGNSWTTYQGVPGNTLYNNDQMDFVTDSIAYLNTTFGTIFKTVNQGNSWIGVRAINRKRLDFLNDSIGYSGIDGVMKTSDGGLTWQRLDTLVGGQDIGFINADEGFVVGEAGRVYRTRNGKNFSLQASVSQENLTRLFLLNTRILIVAGTRGAVLRNNAVSSVKFVSGELPKGFALEQNYPNPFNPSTIINYQLPIASEVKLAVYDMLGRELQTLVNTRQAAGRYSVQWAVSRNQLSSGVYFYRLQAGQFIETKKMLFVK